MAFWHGKALFDAAPEPKSFLWVEDAGHNDVIHEAGSAYWETLYAFSATIIDTQADARNAISYEQDSIGDPRRRI